MGGFFDRLKSRRRGDDGPVDPPSLASDADARATWDALEALLCADLDAYRALFLDERPFDATRLRPDVRRRFESSGLIRIDAARVARGTVRVFPIEGLFVATDLLSHTGTDQVFSLMFEQVHLTQVMDVRPGDHVLELCLGSGVNALTATKRGAARVVGVDVNPRALAFATFNGRLNSVTPPLETRLGSLFEPLGADERFDVVLVNPPFEPVPPGASWFLHSHGGHDGLDLVRTMLPQVPARLADGGRTEMYTWSPGTDRRVTVVDLVAQTFPRHRIEVRLPGWMSLDERIATFRDAPGYAEWRARLVAEGVTRVWDVHVRATPEGEPGVVIVDTTDDRERCASTLELWGL